MAFTIENNQPSAGCIRWTGLHIQYKGVNYTITDGNTNYAYVYWTPAASSTLVVSNTFPVLGVNDCLVFLNKSGTAVVVPSATVLDGSLIVPQSIMANAIAAGTITGDKIAAGTITATNIAVGTISANLIAANAIGADKIAAGAITADKIVSGAVTTAKIAAGAITSNEIAANTIVAGDIAAGTITATELATGSVTAAKITAGTITGDKIAATGIVADKIIGGILNLGGASNGNGVAKIKNASGTDVVTIDNTGILVDQGSYRIVEDNGVQVNIASKDNLIEEPDFESFVGSTYDATYKDYVLNNWRYWAITGTPKLVAKPNGSIFGNLAIAVTSANYLTIAKDLLTLTPGKTYTISSFVTPHYFRNTAASAINYLIEVKIYNGNDALLVTNSFTGIVTSSFVANSVPHVNANGVKRVTGTFTAPAGTEYAVIKIASGGSTQWVVFDGVQLIEGSYPITYMPQKKEPTKITVSDTAPTNPGMGDIWIGGN